MSIRVVCDECRAIQHFADREAAKRFACHRCGRRMTVPERIDSLRQYRPAETDAAFLQDCYTIPRGRFVDRYEVCDTDDQPVLFLDRPRHFRRGWGLGCFALLVFCSLAAGAVGLATAVLIRRGEGAMVAGIVGGILAAGWLTWLLVRWLTPTRKVRFYADREKEILLLEVLARQGRFTILAPRGVLLGTFRKEGFGLMRKSWVCRGPDGEVLLRAVEDSMALSLLRRVLGPVIDVFGGIWGNILQRVFGGKLGLLPTNFNLVGGEGSNRVLGRLDRGLTATKPYTLDLRADQAGKVDRRLALPLAVVLDVDERTS